jgi:hypothetical protein
MSYRWAEQLRRKSAQATVLPTISLRPNSNALTGLRGLNESSLTILTCQLYSCPPEAAADFVPLCRAFIYFVGR